MHSQHLLCAHISVIPSCETLHRLSSSIEAILGADCAIARDIALGNLVTDGVRPSISLLCIALAQQLKRPTNPGIRMNRVAFHASVYQNHEILEAQATVMPKFVSKSEQLFRYRFAAVFACQNHCLS